MLEDAERGAGLPILVAHGVLGCHADGVDGWWTNMLGEGFRVIAPSRFGYFGSALPPNATPADQADAYALLLDHLGIARATVVAYSAGGASALEFARRHPDRVVGLILANARLGGSAPDQLLEPLKPRGLGAVFDGFVSNMVADRFPFEELTVPTLIVSAVDDHWAPYTYAVTAASRIPGAKLVTIDQGGHLFLSHDAQVRTAIGAFIAVVTQREGGDGASSIRVPVLHEG
jgi:pimeloyl-ACP methyl ester carboxylesterase